MLEIVLLQGASQSLFGGWVINIGVPLVVAVI